MLTLRELRTPLGYNQNAMPASDTNLRKTEALSEGQRLQQNDAIVQNNTKEANYENAKNGMTGGVLPVMNVGGDGPLVIGQVNPDLGKVADEALEERLNRKPEQVEPITPQSASIPISANKEAYQDAAPSDASVEEKPLDIRALTDRLAAQQEAERAKFERRRMADRISRMGFALGNLVGAGGGKTDASAITLDDGTKQVGEYRKDMEEINKENQAAYQRALEQIYRKEDQDYKDRSLEASVKKAEEALEETKEHHREMEKIAQGNQEEKVRSNKVKEDQAQQKIDADIKNKETALAQKWASLSIQQQNAELRKLNSELQKAGKTYVYERDSKGRIIKKEVIQNPTGTGSQGSTGQTATANGTSGTGSDHFSKYKRPN
jgi:hypothetical protein